MIEDFWLQGDQELAVWKAAPLGLLVAHIVEHHHLTARMDMASLETLAEEALLLEGPEKPDLLAVRKDISRFCKEFRVHLSMEEQVLFPALLGQTRDWPGRSAEEFMRPLEKLLLDEHQAETFLFSHLRALTEDFPAHPGPRNVRTKLQRTIKAAEKHLLRHVFLENQVLYRRTG